MQTVILKVNPKNGIVILPKNVRKTLGINNTIILNIDHNEAKIVVPKYSIDDILYNLPPLKAVKRISKQEAQDVIEDEIIQRYKNTGL